MNLVIYEIKFPNYNFYTYCETIGWSMCNIVIVILNPFEEITKQFYFEVEYVTAFLL